MILGVELPLEQVYSQDLSDIWLTAGLFMLVTRAAHGPEIFNKVFEPKLLLS